jgi:hypothetical protein
MMASVPPAEGPVGTVVEHVVLWARVSPPSGSEPPRSRRPRPPRSERAFSLTVALRALEARIRAGGGAVEAQLGGQLVATFSAADATEAIELGLELLDEADGYDLGIALALSSTSRDAGLRVGSAFDDSFFLASRAKAGELLVDGSLRDRIGSSYLFARQVSHGGARAGSLDRRYPRRSECVRALAALGRPPLVAATRELVRPFSEALKGLSESSRGLSDAVRGPEALVMLEGPLGAGAVELVDAVHREARAPPMLWLGAASGALATLESLARALAHVPARSETQRRLVAGEIPPLRETAAALLEALGEGPAWIVLNPFAAVDIASLEAVAAARLARRGRISIIARAPHDTPVPSFLGPVSARFTLPALRPADAREAVRAVLGAATPEDVVRRVATLGGDTTLGCEEAARMLISEGDLVREDEAFVWRTVPRSGVEGIGVEELAQARVDLLPADARRVLELISVLPRGASRDLIRCVAEQDGLGPRSVAHALAVLADEGWLAPRDEPGAHFIRRAVQTTMPPSRLSELHRFCADALIDDPAHRHALAHFLLEGGRDAREHARRIGALLGDAGFVHASAHFSGAPARPEPDTAAVRIPVEDTLEIDVTPRQALAVAPYSALAPSSSGMVTVESSLDELDDAVSRPEPRELRRALRERDVPAIERWIEQATLAGAEPASLGRLRAVVDLLRGDFANAEARIVRSGGADGPKPLLAHAMVALGAGRSSDAVRLALRALSLSLRRGDAPDTSAAYHALAACYRAEGREADAEKLRSRAAPT